MKKIKALFIILLFLIVLSTVASAGLFMINEKIAFVFFGIALLISSFSVFVLFIMAGNENKVEE